MRRPQKFGAIFTLVLTLNISVKTTKWSVIDGPHGKSKIAPNFWKSSQETIILSSEQEPKLTFKSNSKIL